MASTLGLAHIASTLVKVSPLYASLNFASASVRRSAAAVILMNGNVEMGGRICVLATPRPATPNRKTSFTKFSRLSLPRKREFGRGEFEPRPYNWGLRRSYTHLGSAEMMLEHVTHFSNSRPPSVQPFGNGMTSLNLATVFSRSSRLERLTFGNLSRHANGRTAYKSPRLVVWPRFARFSGGMRGSNGVLQQPWMMSMLVAGSTRVI